jgi:hypothetical protein
VLHGDARELPAATGALRAAAAASLLTALVAAPVLASPSLRLFGTEIVGRHHDPFTVIEQLRSGGFTLPWFQPLTDGPGWLIARAVGPVAAVNALVLASFPLSAAAAYLLARRLSSPAGALAAALLFAFSPFHVAHAAYHPHVAQTQWLPLYAVALWGALEAATARRLLLLAAATLALGLSNFYWGLVVGVVTVPALLAAAVAAPRTGAARAAARCAFVLACLTAVVVGTLVALEPPSPHRYAAPPAEAALFSARPASYLLPPAHHPLLGSWSAQLVRREGLAASLLEQQVGLGWSVLALAAIAIATAVRDGGRALRAATWIVAAAALAFLCSLAPAAALLHAAAPMFRAFARFGVVVQLAAAVLAGSGLAALLRRPSRGRQLVAVGLLVAAAFEYLPFPPWHWRDVLPTRAHRWLAGQPLPMCVLDCVPPSAAEQSVPALLDRPLLLAEGPLQDCGEPDLTRKLAWRGVSHVLVRRETAAGGWLWQAKPQPGLRIVAAFDDSAVLAVTPVSPLATPFVLDLAGFSARESVGPRAWRWMGREAAWTLASLAAGPQLASVELELSAFAVRRQLELRLDGLRVAELDVPTAATLFVVGPLVVPSGRSRLVFQAREPAVVADALLGNGDRRALTVALGRWRWRSNLATIRGGRP